MTSVVPSPQPLAKEPYVQDRNELTPEQKKLIEENMRQALQELKQASGDGPQEVEMRTFALLPSVGTWIAASPSPQESAPKVDIEILRCAAEDVFSKALADGSLESALRDACTEVLQSEAQAPPNDRSGSVRAVLEPAAEAFDVGTSGALQADLRSLPPSDWARLHSRFSWFSCFLASRSTSTLADTKPTQSCPAASSSAPGTRAKKASKPSRTASMGTRAGALAKKATEPLALPSNFALAPSVGTWLQSRGRVVQIDANIEAPARTTPVLLSDALGVTESKATQQLSLPSADTGTGPSSPTVVSSSLDTDLRSLPIDGWALIHARFPYSRAVVKESPALPAHETVLQPDLRSIPPEDWATLHGRFLAPSVSGNEASPTTSLPIDIRSQPSGDGVTLRDRSSAPSSSGIDARRSVSPASLPADLRSLPPDDWATLHRGFLAPSTSSRDSAPSPPPPAILPVDSGSTPQDSSEAMHTGSSPGPANGETMPNFEEAPAISRSSSEIRSEWVTQVLGKLASETGNAPALVMQATAEGQPVLRRHLSTAEIGRRLGLGGSPLAVSPLGTPPQGTDSGEVPRSRSQERLVRPSDAVQERELVGQGEPKVPLLDLSSVRCGETDSDDDETENAETDPDQTRRLADIEAAAVSKVENGKQHIVAGNTTISTLDMSAVVPPGDLPPTPRRFKGVTLDRAAPEGGIVLARGEQFQARDNQTLPMVVSPSSTLSLLKAASTPDFRSAPALPYIASPSVPTAQPGRAKRLPATQQQRKTAHAHLKQSQAVKLPPVKQGRSIAGASKKCGKDSVESSVVQVHAHIHHHYHFFPRRGAADAPEGDPAAHE